MNDINKPEKEPSPELKQLIEITQRALIKASAEAKRIAEQIGTDFIVVDTSKEQNSL